MSIYAVADLHGWLPLIPEDCTTLLIVGDICPDFEPRSDPAPQSAWLDTTFREWLDSFPAAVVAIWGNHDFVGEHPALVPKLPWTLLRDSECEVEGLRVFGTPWVPGLPRWAFYAKPDALRLRAEAIPVGIDILMTHGPPYGAGDLIPWTPKYSQKYGTPPEGERVGDPYLVKGLDRAVPTVVVCGHIHEDRGYHLSGDVPVINCAAVDGNYNPYPNPCTLLQGT